MASTANKKAEKIDEPKGETTKTAAEVKVKDNAPKGDAPQSVKITATRLRGVEDKVERAVKILADADADLAAMLAGKDPERSPIVAQVVEIKHLLDTTKPAFEDVPGRVTRVIDDVEGML